MTPVSAERLALQQTDAERSRAREDKRPSFESHVRQDEGGARQADEKTTDLRLAPNAVRAAGTAAQMLADTLRTRPMASAVAVYGEGATIYPQGLAVVGYLSMLPPGSAEAGAPAPAGVVSSNATSEALPAQASAPIAMAQTSTVTANQVDAPSLQAVVVSGLDDTDGGDGSDLMRVTTSETAELSLWLLRRLSFGGQGADATLRLRDYRLASGDEPVLVQHLLRFAKEQGWPVARIVVNGHEIWRPPGAVPSHLLQGVEHHVG